MLFIIHLTCTSLLNYCLMNAKAAYPTKSLFSLKKRSCFAMPSNINMSKEKFSDLHLTRKGIERRRNAYPNYIKGYKLLDIS